MWSPICDRVNLEGEEMVENLYQVRVGKCVVAKGMRLEDACLFAKALFQEYGNDMELEVTIALDGGK